ncbi:MAG TPA: hypothetical protein VGM19_06365 [Armatimonadota bacterium]|jgi:lipid-A-disaccharide synthase
MPKALDVFMVAGEPSGDLSASLVAACLRDAGATLRGAAGPLMRAAGVEPLFPSESWGTMGLGDSLRRVPLLYRRMRQLAASLVAEPPDVLVLVDFGAFNVRLARRVRRARPELPILYYFPPSSWDPRPRDRSWLAPLVDAVATPFAHSARLLQQDGVPAVWVGHPVLDRLAPVTDRAEFRRRHDLPAGAPVIGLMPGSRALERKCLSRPLLETVKWLAPRLPEARFLWSVLPQGPRVAADAEALRLPGVQGVADSATLLSAADLVITAMGTATLEAAAVDCLPLTVYRGNAAMWLQWKLTDLGTDLYAMPNILLGEKVIPELVHREVKAARLGAEVLEVWGDPRRQAQLHEALGRVRAALGTPGASQRTAEMILRLGRGEPLPVGIEPTRLQTEDMTNI